MANYRKLFYDASELAQMTGFSKPKLYELMRKGILPSAKVGKHRVFTEDHLKTFLKNCTTTPPPSSPTEVLVGKVL